jgi:hypothetical protein
VGLLAAAERDRLSASRVWFGVETLPGEDRLALAVHARLKMMDR